MNVHRLGKVLGRKSGTVRIRLTLWNIAVLALALAGFAVTVRYAVQATMDASVDAELAHTAHHLAGRFTRPPGHDGDNHRPPAPSPVAFHRDDSYHPAPKPAPQRTDPPPDSAGQSARTDSRSDLRRPRVFDSSGKQLFGDPAEAPLDEEGFRQALAGRSVPATVMVDGEAVRVYSMPLSLGRGRPGVLQIAHPLGELRALLNEMTRVLLLLIPLVLLLAGIGGAFLTDRSIRPVRQVIQAARHIGAEDLSLRLPVSGNDEFSELAATFNGMIGRLQEAFQRLEQAYEQQNRFTGDASHELRTPLTTIKAEISLALLGERTPEEYRQALRVADQSADAMARIVQDMLLLARSDSGQLAVRTAPVSAAELLRRSIAASRHQGAPVEVVPVDPALQIAGDQDHLVRLLVNLVENAARHTPPDGKITAAARAEGDDVVVTVRDTGEGIPPEHLPHVCERFYRVDAARSRSDGGTGLGLAICQSIVGAHHGSMDLQSAVGEGTTVTIRLPRFNLHPDDSRSTHNTLVR